MPNTKKLKEEEIESALEKVKSYATETYEKISETTVESAKMVDETVKQNPWKSVGVAAVAGVAAGVILKKNNK